jgi:hypothetical protein
MKEMVTYKGCYFRDNNVDNDGNDDYDYGDDRDERKRCLYLALLANIG